VTTFILLCHFFL